MILNLAYAAQICAMLKKDSDLFLLPYEDQSRAESEFVFYKRRRSMFLVLERLRSVCLPDFSLIEGLDASNLVALLDDGKTALSYDEDKGQWALYYSDKISAAASTLPNTIPLFEVKPQYFDEFEQAMLALQSSKI